MPKVQRIKIKPLEQEDIAGLIETVQNHYAVVAIERDDDR